MDRLTFFNVIDDFLLKGAQKVKISKGSGRHVCFLCDKWLQKRKMKLIGYENKKSKSYVLCFGCWGDYKEWEHLNGQTKPVKQEVVATASTRFYLPVNRRF